MLIKHETKRSVSVGGKTFRANSDDVIEVPDDAVQFLLPAHGFVRFDKSHPTPERMQPLVVEPKKRGRPRKQVSDDTKLSKYDRPSGKPNGTNGETIHNAG